MKVFISWQSLIQITWHIIINTLNKNKNMTFLHSGRVWVWVRGGYIYPRYPSRTRIMKSRKTQTQSNRKKPIKSRLVWTGTHGHRFCCHAYQHTSYLFKKILKKKWSWLKLRLKKKNYMKFLASKQTKTIQLEANIN